MFAEAAAAIEAMPIAAFVRSSVWAYPALNIGHILGLLLAIGGVLLLDLRLLGAGGGRLPWREISAALSPAITVGFVLLLLTGVPMAMSDAKALLASPVFGWKLGLIALAVLNALAFRRRAWAGAEPPAVARAQAALSIALWLGAVAAGRLLGYL